jgi:hypothetical protein
VYVFTYVPICKYIYTYSLISICIPDAGVRGTGRPEKLSTDPDLDPGWTEKDDPGTGVRGVMDPDRVDPGSDDLGWTNPGSGIIDPDRVDPGSGKLSPSTPGPGSGPGSGSAEEDDPGPVLDPDLDLGSGDPDPGPSRVDPGSGVDPDPDLDPGPSWVDPGSGADPDPGRPEKDDLRLDVIDPDLEVTGDFDPDLMMMFS